MTRRDTARQNRLHHGDKRRHDHNRRDTISLILIAARVSSRLPRYSVPIVEALERCDARFAAAWWHWFFFAQPEKPERAILADPEGWYAKSAPREGDESYPEFLAAIRDPATVHGMVEDYRAGLGIDRQNDVEDRAAGRRVACPTLALWSLRDDLERLYGDVLAVWRPWVNNLTGRGLDCGHHMAEEAPEELAAELLRFLL